MVTPDVHFALTLSQLDPSMLILNGLSTAGALARRAVVIETRVTAISLVVCRVRDLKRDCAEFDLIS